MPPTSVHGGYKRDLRAKHRDKQKGTVRRLRGRSFAEHLTPIIGGSSLRRIVLALLPRASPGPTACPPSSFFPLRYVMRFPFPLLNTHQPPVIVLNFLQSYNYVGLRGVSPCCYVDPCSFLTCLACFVKYLSDLTPLLSRDLSNLEKSLLCYHNSTKQRFNEVLEIKKIILSFRQYINEAPKKIISQLQLFLRYK